MNTFLVDHGPTTLCMNVGGIAVGAQQAAKVNICMCHIKYNIHTYMYISK